MIGSTASRELAELGFYKFVDGAEPADIDRQIENGAYDWYTAAGRAFDGDAERLAEGGVTALLMAMEPTLTMEGVVLPALEDVHDPVRGYSLRVGSDPYPLWSEQEAKQSWELTCTRTMTLVDGWLARAGSDERLHLIGGGHDGVFVLLTPAMQKLIAASGIFKPRDIPAML